MEKPNGPFEIKGPPPLEDEGIEHLEAVQRLSVPGSHRLAKIVKDIEAAAGRAFRSSTLNRMRRRRRLEQVRLVGNSGPVMPQHCETLEEYVTQCLEAEPAAEAPLRNYDCKNYDSCLGLAAALDWDSFTCKGCSGCINSKLLWRAHSEIKKNRDFADLCDLPDLKDRSEE